LIEDRPGLGLAVEPAKLVDALLQTLVIGSSNGCITSRSLALALGLRAQ